MYKEAAHEMLVKLTPGINFITILLALFSYEILAPKIKAETFGFETFWQRDIGKKLACKMLMKLTPEIAIALYEQLCC